jgi:predicted ATPase
MIGREVELARLHRWLPNPHYRLITIAGAGGVGKTRLALEAATQVRSEFVGGIRLVALAETASGERLDPAQARSALAGAIAGALGIAIDGPDGPAELCDRLHEAELLLLLDSVEHLSGGADLIVELLRGAPNVSVLATSRQPLNLQAELIVWLHGLPVPLSEEDPNALSASSVSLFAERVERTGVELRIAEQLPEVLQICRLAAGLPLAIELAALLAGRRPLDEIGRLMRDDPGALATSAGDLPERHRSLRALFESSWRLLPEAERRVLARCSVFPGSFTREAAEQTCSDSSDNDREPPRDAQPTIRDLLAALVNKSLLHLSSEGRYELPALLRPFAAEQLSEQAQRTI